MTKMSDLAYDIEQLYIEGYSARSISVHLKCPIDLVYGWIEGQNVADKQHQEADYSTD